MSPPLKHSGARLCVVRKMDVSVFGQSRPKSTVWGRQVEYKVVLHFFKEVPLGQHGSCSSAQLPVELSENLLQNLFLNLPPRTVCIFQTLININIVRLDLEL